MCGHRFSHTQFCLTLVRERGNLWDPAYLLNDLMAWVVPPIFLSFIWAQRPIMKYPIYPYPHLPLIPNAFLWSSYYIIRVHTADNWQNSRGFQGLKAICPRSWTPFLGKFGPILNTIWLQFCRTEYMMTLGQSWVYFINDLFIKWPVTIWEKKYLYGFHTGRTSSSSNSHLTA